MILTDSQDPILMGFQRNREARLIDTEKILSGLPDELKKLVLQGQSLKQRTTLQIGGPAALLCEVQNTEHAQRFQEICFNNNLPLFVLGGGSNILAADEGFPGMVLRVSTQEFLPAGDTLVAGAGLDFDTLISRSLASGLSGLEFASGIPGTLGGAIMGNAGCYGHEIGEFLVEAITLAPDGTIKRRGPEDFGFQYRATSLAGSGEILLQATLKLTSGGVEAATNIRDEKIADRQRKHPQNLPSAGSWFRNLPPAVQGQRRVAAGSLLEKVGSKDMHEGDARVFQGHANMIVNTGSASCKQVQKLARRMQDAVWDKFQVKLVQEVRHLGPPA